MATLDEDYIKQLIVAHNIHNTQECTLKENRFRDSTNQLYCWRGIVRQKPDCMIADTCSPFSYTDARTRFCVQFGCEQDLFVANPEGMHSPVANRRGGIVVFNQPKECEGAAGTLSCFADGIVQSFDKLANPERSEEVLTSFVMLTAAALGITMFFAVVPQSRAASKSFFKGISYS